jgi:hypothetical protein
MKKLYRSIVTLLVMTVFWGGSLFAENPTARLQVIHNAADPAASSVDVYLNGNLAIEGFSFRAATPYIDVPAGVDISVGIAPANSTDANDTLANFVVQFADGGTYIAIANGVLDPNDFASNPDGLDIAFTLFAKGDAREASTEANEVQFFVFHGATDAPSVDVLARGVGKIVDGASYGAMTDYLSVPATSYILDITPAGMNEVVVATYEADLTGLEGGAAAVLASGFLSPGDNQDGEAFALIAVLPDGTVLELPVYTETFTVTFNVDMTNASPFNPQTDDVYISGSFAGWPQPGTNPDLKLEPSESGSNIYTLTLNLEAGVYQYKYFRVIENNPSWDNGEWPGDPDRVISVFRDRTVNDLWGVQKTEETARLQVIHNAADPAAAEVDIYINGEKTISNFGFRQATPFIDIPAEVVLEIGVAAAGSQSAADTLKNFVVMFNDGETYVAIANGILDPSGFVVNPDGIDIGFTILAKTDAREASTDQNEVQFFIVHGATDAPAVDISARGVAMLATNVPYGALSEYLAVPADQYIIDILPAGTGTPVASYDLDISGLEGGSAVIIASGFLNPGANQNGPAFALIAVLADGTVLSIPTGIEQFFSQDMPASYSLSQNYPNPFNPSTTIQFAIPLQSTVNLDIYNMLGQKVATLIHGEEYSTGIYNVVWNGLDSTGKSVSSGMYIYRINAGEYQATKSMMLLK